jgi:hypothetical protein
VISSVVCFSLMYVVVEMDACGGATGDCDYPKHSRSIVCRIDLGFDAVDARNNLFFPSPCEGL